MRRPSLPILLLMGLVAPLPLLAQSAGDSLSTPAVVAATDSIAKAANAAAAANTVAINFVWTLVAGFLVMFMQAGFAMVETGFTRAKNAAHTATMNFMVYGVAMMAYWAVGFAIQAGGVGALGGPRKLQTPRISFDRLDRRPRVGPVWHPGLLPHRRGLHRAGVRLLPVPDGVHGHHRHDPDRRPGGAVEVHVLLRVQRSSSAA